MNIITRIKNNLEYAHHRKIRDKAIAKMKEHVADADDLEFKKWANIGLESSKRCLEIPLK